MHIGREAASSSQEPLIRSISIFDCNTEATSNHRSLILDDLIFNNHLLAQMDNRMEFKPVLASLWRL